jgi:cbb3-type cytochrome c oxidase subunit II
MKTPWTALIVFLAVPTVTVVATALRPPSIEHTESGRQVYINEGCIHCHSQFVRPGTIDEELWGEARDPEFSRSQAPALIGNRRQGPDLMNVGVRRVRDWQRMHLINPRLVAARSRMPSYAHLFASGDPRGEALLDYLDSLGREAELSGGAADSTIAPAAPGGDNGGSGHP